MGDVDYLPIWKRGATAEEWLQEIAQIAAKHPEWFAAAVIFMQETKPNGCTKLRRYSRDASTNDIIAITEVGKHDLLIEVSR